MKINKFEQIIDHTCPLIRHQILTKKGNNKCVVSFDMPLLIEENKAKEYDTKLRSKMTTTKISFRYGCSSLNHSDFDDYPMFGKSISMRSFDRLKSTK